MMIFKKLKKYSFISDILIFTCFVLFAGFLSVYYGIERMYDTRNYHIYNPWAFLTGRIGYDIIPAGIQSYFNPFLDIPYYLAVKYLNNYPTLITFLMGFHYALFLFIIYKLTNLIFKDYHKVKLTILSVYVASGIGIILRCLGWLSHDTFLGFLILLAIYLLLQTFDKKYSPKQMLCAGLILGICVGLKYTTAIFVVPIGVTLPFFYKQFTNPIKSYAFFVLGGVIGFLLADGFWMYKLYQTFGNPFFPYFNWLLPSEDIALQEVFTTDFSHQLPKGIKKILQYPLQNSDRRYYLLYYLTLINIFTFPLVNKKKFENIFRINIRHADFILTISVLAYFLWVNTFGTQRYYAPILGTIVIVSAIIMLKLLYILNNIIQLIGRKLPIFKRLNFKYIENFCLLGFFTFFIIIFLPKYTLGTEKKLIRIPITDNLLVIENLNLPDDSIVFLTGGTGIILPFQNPNVKYIKINPLEFSRKGEVLYSDKKFQEIKNDIKDKNQLFIIANFDLSRDKETDINAIQTKLQQNLEKEQEKKELLDLLDMQNKYMKKNKKQMPNIPSERELLKNLRNIRMNNISASEFTLLELHRLEVNYENIECRPIYTNMFDANKLLAHQFYICRIDNL